MSASSRPPLRAAALLAWALTLLAAVAAFVAFDAAPARAQERSPDTRHVDLLEATGEIGPGFRRYVERGIATAEADGAELLVIRLDTPGGNVAVTNEVVQRMLASRVPIAVWIGPRGAMAASAGTFVTLAAHVAAMAPQTTIGAASPIDGRTGNDLQETLRRKLDNVLVAQVRGLAERRGRHAADWAESTIREARADPEVVARELNVIDFVAEDLRDLLRQTDGHVVTIDGVAIALHTLGAEVRTLDPSPFEELTNRLMSPNVAFVLLTLGLLGLLYELTTPGVGVPGIAGGICLALGVYALGLLPSTIVGPALMLLAFVLFLVDVKAGGTGVFALGGVVSLLLGGLLLFESPEYRVSTHVLLGTVALVGAFFFAVVAAAARALRRPVATGREALAGRRGVAQTPLVPEGLVRVAGETWKATAAEGEIPRGAPVEVLEVTGLRMRVRACGAPAQEV